ncbi:MAG TPA: cytochrome c oxidase assembly protein [Xanthobacteraceae bacterium]|nr:cytochrome c oxidase assembly protein [Xanthobacteraceae bacterium]
MTAELADLANPVAKIAYVALFAAAIVLWWLCSAHPAILPFWAPWDFSWVEFLSAWFAIVWYIRGLSLVGADCRPSPARRAAFFVGVLLIYSVLETHFEYFAEHQFFYNRIQHVVMHHLGPLLIALAWPGEVLWYGSPAFMRRIVAHRFVIGIVRSLQQPVLAVFLFSGSFFFWLIPSVHFRAMVDPNLYSLMNWTMVADGLLFWCLLLDPRPAPPARVSFGTRIALAFVVMPPQIVGGSIIALSSHDLYSFYSLCGRIYPQLSAGTDQAIGGLIIWIPPAMMSVAAALFILNNIRLVEDRSTDKWIDEENNGCWVVDSSQWTGR